MLWVYSRHYKYFNFSVCGSNLDVRFGRLKSIPALKELTASVKCIFTQLKLCRSDPQFYVANNFSIHEI